MCGSRWLKLWLTVGLERWAQFPYLTQVLLLPPVQYAKIEDAKAQALKAAAGDGEAPTSPVSRQANSAEHLVLYGISKVADKLSRWVCGCCHCSVQWREGER